MDGSAAGDSEFEQWPPSHSSNCGDQEPDVDAIETCVALDAVSLLYVNREKGGSGGDGVCKCAELSLHFISCVDVCNVCYAASCELRCTSGADEKTRGWTWAWTWTWTRVSSRPVPWLLPLPLLPLLPLLPPLPPPLSRWVLRSTPAASVPARRLQVEMQCRRTMWPFARALDSLSRVLAHSFRLCSCVVDCSCSALSCSRLTCCVTCCVGGALVVYCMAVRACVFACCV
jgi:hypothetical protein